MSLCFTILKQKYFCSTILSFIASHATKKMFQSMWLQGLAMMMPDKHQQTKYSNQNIKIVYLAYIFYFSNLEKRYLYIPKYGTEIWKTILITEAVHYEHLFCRIIQMEHPSHIA